MKYVALALLIGGLAMIAKGAREGLDGVPLGLLGCLLGAIGAGMLLVLWFVGLA